MCLFGISFGVVFCTACLVHADTVVSFAAAPLWLSSTHVLEGESVMISTVVMKKKSERVDGVVTFKSGTSTISSAPFSLPSTESGAVVSVSWVPNPGSHNISAHISQVSVGEQAAHTATELSSVQSKEVVIVRADTDRDRVADSEDGDDDNDGITDTDEKKNGTNPKVSDSVQRTPEVAGVATTTDGLIEQARTIASSTHNALLRSTESFRLNGAEYFDMKLQEAEKKRADKIAAVQKLPSIDDIAEKKMLPLSEQFADASGILEGVTIQAYRLLVQLFSNIYAFYLVLIFLVLWILRTIWKRFSIT